MVFAVLIFFLIFSLLVLVVMASAFLGFLLTRVPYVRTDAKDIELIVKKLDLNSKDVFYDLGSGDGKVVFLVERFSGALGKGFELTWWTYIVSKLKSYIFNSRARFFCKDFFKADWSDATVIYGYLYPPLMGRVEEKFKQNCKPGTRAVIRDFPFPNMQPVEKILISPELDEGKVPLTKQQLSSKWFRVGLLFKGLWKSTRPMSHTVYVYQK
jgi:hypothetical protein